MSHSFACRAASLLLLVSASVAQIAPGNLIVVRAGDGAFGLTNSSQRMFLDEYDRTTSPQAAPLRSIGNTPPSSLYITVVSIGTGLSSGIPLSLVGGASCALLYPPALDILLNGFTNGAGAGSTPLPLGPADSALWGLDLPVQHLVFDPATYGSFGLPFDPSRGMQLTIGS